MHSRFLNTLILAICMATQSFAQYSIELVKANGDCNKAITVNTPVFGPVSPPEGYGNIMEIKGGINHPYYFAKEHNTVWYKLVSPLDGIFTFNLIPESEEDDYDFILFKSETDFCTKIRTNNIKPLRACISRNDKTIGSRTGLKHGEKNEFIPQGPGPSYAKPLEVNKGDEFYIVIDNVYKNGKGHTLHLNFESIVHEPEKKEAVNNNFDEYQEANLNIILADKVSGEIINGNIIITELDNSRKKAPVKVENMSMLYVKVIKNTMYKIEALSQGYMMKVTDTIFSSFTSETITLKIELERPSKGDRINFTNILFYGNEARFLEESYPALHNLADFMDMNPTIKIEIHGHVNNPLNTRSYNSEAFNMDLSIRRAKAVYDYLIKENINKNRLGYKGFGSSKMIYPYAQTEEEQKLNRRVEILVVED